MANTLNILARMAQPTSRAAGQAVEGELFGYA